MRAHAAGPRPLAVRQHSEGHTDQHSGLISTPPGHRDAPEPGPPGPAIRGPEVPAPARAHPAEPTRPAAS